MSERGNQLDGGKDCGVTPASDVATARRMYESWNQGTADEQERMNAILHPQLTYKTSGLWPDFDPVYRGHEGFSKFRQEMLEAWEYLRIEPRSIEEHGEWMIVELDFTGRGRGSGVTVELEFHHALRFRDGLLYELEACRTRAQALAAAGLAQ